MWVLITTIMIAISQPFIVNSITLFVSKWFPIKERATATAVAIGFTYVGIMIGMIVTPNLTILFGIPGMLKIYGGVVTLLAVLFFLFVRENPPTPPAESVEHCLVLTGLKTLFKESNMILLVIIFFFGLGIFNAVTTWIEQIVVPRGFSIVDAGNFGGALFLGGIIGCCIIPLISDKLANRKWIIVSCMLFSIPGLISLTFTEDYYVLLVSVFALGFFFMSSGPVIFQYGAEISYPAPEALSMGILQMVGNAAGVVFVFCMDGLRGKAGSMTPFMIILSVLMLINVVLGLFLKESRLTVLQSKSLKELPVKSN